MTRKGFPSKRRSWILGCLLSVIFVHIEGSPSGFFHLLKGCNKKILSLQSISLGRGCPQLPVIKSIKQILFRSFDIKDGIIQVSCLQCADVKICFLSGNSASLYNSKYELMFRKSLQNEGKLEKKKLFFAIEISSEKGKVFCRQLGLQKEGVGNSFYGAPFGRKSKITRVLGACGGTFSQKLSSRKKKFSLEGRIT